MMLAIQWAIFSLLRGLPIAHKCSEQQDYHCRRELNSKCTGEHQDYEHNAICLAH